MEEVNNDEKLAMITIIVLYEYLSVTLIGDATKQGLTLRIIQEDSNNLGEKFILVMKEFEKQVQIGDLDKEDKNTCDLIINSFNENISISKRNFENFMKDIKLSLTSNTKFNALMEKYPSFNEKFFGRKDQNTFLNI